ncbi:MAG: signal peptidase I [Gemmatimonadales bacterium]
MSRALQVRRRLGTVAALILGGVVGWALLASGVQLRRVTSASMMPTYEVGSWLVSWERSDITAGSLDRGDVVVFRYPFGSDLRAIKRVVALPGDRVEVRADAVVVNGEEIAVASPLGPGQPPPVRVPGVLSPGTVFVLGDNSANSIDSRSFGPVAAEQLTGRVLARVPFASLTAVAWLLGAALTIAGFIIASRARRARNAAEAPLISRR